MHSEECGVKGAVEKQVLRDETPVDRPHEEELPAQVEGPRNVPDRVLQQEWHSQYQLHQTPQFMQRQSSACGASIASRK